MKLLEKLIKEIKQLTIRLRKEIPKIMWHQLAITQFITSRSLSSLKFKFIIKKENSFKTMCFLMK